MALTKVSLNSKFRPKLGANLWLWSLTIAHICLTPTLVKATPENWLDPQKSHSCTQVEIAADNATCEQDVCVLLGNVVLTCPALRLWADEVHLKLNQDQSFAGATALGNVVLVDSDSVLRCSQIVLGPDQIQGKIDNAKLQIKRQPITKDAQGIPIGRDQAVFNGQIERHESEVITLKDADLTMCDCQGARPSWRLNAKEINAVLGERATLWWPSFWINPFNLGLVPITPPLLPLSLPLKKRAAGFLPPQPIFYSSAWPTIDLPFFMPLGESWDVTLAPGLRTDWSRHHLTPPSNWGAPRLGARLRYAPGAFAIGETQVQWTHDGKHRAAKNYFAAEAPTNAEINAVANQAERELLINEQKSILLESERRKLLVERVALNVVHRSDFGQKLRWLVDAEWLSDDLIPADFEISLEDRSISYLPSRSELIWRSPGLGGLIQVNHLLRLDNNNEQTDLKPTTAKLKGYSNVWGAEKSTIQPGPSARFQLLPVAILGPIYADADISLARYGPWDPSYAPTLVLGGLNAGLAFFDNLGPLKIKARSSALGLIANPTTPQQNQRMLALNEIDVSTDLARSFGSLIHAFSPRLAFSNLPWAQNKISKENIELDPYLGVTRFSQLLFGFDQTLWQRTKNQLAPLARLSLGQPLDANSGQLLNSRLSADFFWQPNFTFKAFVDLNPNKHLAVEEIATKMTITLGPVRLGGDYGRITKYAERFRRELLELSATTPELLNSPSVHVIQGFVAINLSDRVRASYSSNYLLPVPSESERLIGFSVHNFSAGYRSPCDCWEVQLDSSFPTIDTRKNFRIQLTFNFAGFVLGS